LLRRRCCGFVLRFTPRYTIHLKNSDRFECSKWCDIVKTGVHKELAPTSEDWYFVRAASIARKVYLKPGVGIGALRKWYGGQYRRGSRAKVSQKAAGGVIRSILQQLESRRRRSWRRPSLAAARSRASASRTSTASPARSREMTSKCAVP
jgi:hypothetical protein